MTVRTDRYTRIFSWLGMFLLLSGVLLPATTYAQSSPAVTTSSLTSAALQIESSDGALHLQWQGGVQAASTGEAATTAVPYGGYLLPLQSVQVEISSDQPQADTMAAVTVEGMSSTPFTGELTPAPRINPPALDYVPSPLNTPYTGDPHLPTSPIFVLNDGWQRGRHLVTLGFSPIYQDPDTGQILAVETIDANVAGASEATAIDVTANPNDASLFAPIPNLAPAPGPTNPLANSNAHKLLVSKIGLQQLSGADLAAAGFNKASKLHLYLKGIEVPLHIIDNGNDVLEADDYLRFYASSNGDAWNTQGVYWLTEGGEDGLRMLPRDATPTSAATRNTAYEIGQVQKSSVYETKLAGADGDNWFQANLIADGGPDSFDITLPHQLPLSSALPTLLTLNMTPYSLSSYGSSVSHRLQISSGGFNQTDNFDVQFLGAYPFQDIARSVSLNTAADQWSITLLQETNGRAIMMDAIDYSLGAVLDFAGKGAFLQGVDGIWRYHLVNAPTDTPGGDGLYDITNPALPQRLIIQGGSTFDFQDGPAVHRYLMTGDGTLFAPTILSHTPVNLGVAGAAHEIFISPFQFYAALQPLVLLRKDQGYLVQIVDVQAIYDSWSYGFVDAKAIRSFLRFAAGNYSPAPVAAVLVGDGTWDPHNFTGNNNPDVIPPYIANEDPWIKYVPCDSCYGQLDGDDPSNDYLIDVWIGRFPVIDTTELSTVVDKIVRYEKAKDTTALWRSSSLQIADDDIHPDNSVDPAGPFVGSAENSIKLMPTNIRQLRNYFMAATDFSNASPSLLAIMNEVKSFYVADPDEALQNSIDIMNSGVGIVTYTGHANHWQWARIVPNEVADAPNKWLFGLWDVLSLHNTNSPFISMSMTCYTSQFHIPALSHFTIDEHLFLYGNGGAIATWGPEGFSIVPAHDELQAGFHEALWKAPLLQAKLGALTAAGYNKVLTSPDHNLDVTKTFAFMGDPLTSARVVAMDKSYMPKLSH